MYRVLLVDDEPIVLSSLSAILPWDLLECQLVGTAANGMDAYNKICDEYPDIVITDIKMPLLNGLELIERAKKLDADIDFVVLSGYDDFAFAQSAMKFGVKSIAINYDIKVAKLAEEYNIPVISMDADEDFDDVFMRMKALSSDDLRLIAEQKDFDWSGIDNIFKNIV